MKFREKMESFGIDAIVNVKDMDRAIENFRMGSVSPAIDLSDF